MKFLVKKFKNGICGLCKKPANRGVVTFLDAYGWDRRVVNELLYGREASNISTN